LEIQIWEFRHFLQGFKLKKGFEFLVVCLEFD
jgi:hypothetical protein